MARKKKKKLKKSVKITLILIILLIFTIKYINKDKETTNIVIDKTEQLLKKESYLNKSINNSNTEIKKEWEELIVNYIDLYYKSLIGLETKDVTKLFTDKDSSEAYFIQNAIDLLITHHKSQTNDMTLTKAYYDIEFTGVKIEDDLITINFLQDDYYTFKYLKNIESKAIDVENEIVIKKNKDNYTIESLRVVQGNFVMFTNELNLNEPNVKKEIDTLKEKYLNSIKEEVETNKDLIEEANNEAYDPFIECDNEYDRDKAVNYSYKYADARNDLYDAFDDIGGNCQNYVSQSLHEGGIPMDLIGDYEWKYFDSAVNEDNEEKGRSTSWTGTTNFYDYAKENQGFGLCADVDENIFYAEPGDVAHVGYKGFSHAVIVVKEIFDKEGKKIDFLVNSNTASLENYPFLGYVYPNKRVIKVLGYNDK